MRRAWRRGFVGFVFLMTALSAPAQQEGPPGGLRPGDALPELTGVDLEGRPAGLGTLLGTRTLVLSFWSVYCTDCIRELDDLRAVRREFGPDEVAVVAVNTDSGLPVRRIADFVRRYESARGPANILHLLDRNARILEGLGIRYVPLLVVVDRSGRVSSVLTGYGPEDRFRMVRAVKEGGVALGRWSEGMRGRLVSALRAAGPGGRSVEWGSFRVEAELPLFGLYDNSGWIADAAGRRDREREARRVEQVVADRLKVGLMLEALAAVGVRLPPPPGGALGPGGLRVPESPLAGDTRWSRLYRMLGFDTLYREEDRQGVWTGDVYRAGLVGDVDLGRLRERLRALGIPGAPQRLRLVAVSDYDFKVRALLAALERVSFRLRQSQGDRLIYYGTAKDLLEEIRALRLGLAVHAEPEGADGVRVELY